MVAKLNKDGEEEGMINKEILWDSGSSRKGNGVRAEGGKVSVKAFGLTGNFVGRKEEGRQEECMDFEKKPLDPT